ncbi:MAG: PTS sugar transporter subunit IIA [Gemmatimonadales bacterium]
MNLADHLEPADIHLSLMGTTRAAVLSELADLLGLGAENGLAIRRMLSHREESGSTGIGRGVAVPHCRTPLVKRLRVLYGRRLGGVDWGAIDGAPVEHFFLLVAPPMEGSNEYLPVLGRIARLAKEPDVPARLSAAASAADLRRLLEERGG